MASGAGPHSKLPDMLFSGLLLASDPYVRSLDDMPSTGGDSGGSTGTYTIVIRFNTDGTFDFVRSILGDTIPMGTYVDPVDGAADTWVRCTSLSGEPPSGGASLNTWLRLTSARQFSLSYNSGNPPVGADFITGTWRFELSNRDGGIVFASADIDITVGETS
jgi:hypothetical protein